MTNNVITNKYDFMFFLECDYANMNGDPEYGNLTRTDFETGKGWCTATSIKRKIRDYVQLAYPDKQGMEIFVQRETFMNRFISELYEKAVAKHLAGGTLTEKEAKELLTAKEKKDEAGEGKKDKKLSKQKIVTYTAREMATKRFYDVRTFGAVMSTGKNAGQVQGPVCINPGKTLDEIRPELASITRCCITGGKSSSKELLVEENDTDTLKLHTMGTWAYCPYGLYKITGHISAGDAAKTGFTEDDLRVLFESILNMCANTRSASKSGINIVSPLIIFKHTGKGGKTPEDIVRRAILGSSGGINPFELVDVTLKDNSKLPETYKDYSFKVNLQKRPEGIDIGFQRDPYGEPVWNTLLEDENWVEEA